jgi:anti-sigma regulatory factor (Ser/Thr protein kinase)
MVEEAHRLRSEAAGKGSGQERTGAPKTVGVVDEVACSDIEAEHGDRASLDVVFDAAPRSISMARHAVARLIDPTLRIPSELAEDVLLLVSELVTNAVLHARTAVHVSARAQPGRILVAVGDDDPHNTPEQTEAGSTATSGRGMRLVDLLASSWGVEMGSTSKVVWFEVVYQPGPIDLRVRPEP